MTTDMMKTATLSLFLLLAGCHGADDGSISASGTIEATEVTVGAKVGGTVVSLRVDEGSVVHKGDTLAILDRTDNIIALRQAEANAAATSAAYSLALNGARREDIAQAEATLANATSDLHRMEGLIASGSATQKQVDDARTKLVLADQAYQKLRTGSRNEDIESARARRDQAAAQVDALKQKIDDAVVHAPLDGTVTETSVEQGEIVQPMGAVVKLTQLDRVHLMIYVTEQELARVKLGQSVKISIDGEPGKTFPGTVTYISPVAEFTPRNIQTKEDRTKLVFGVKVEAENADHLLKSGMPADAVIEAAGTPGAAR